MGATTATMLHEEAAKASTDIDATHLRVNAGDTLYKIAQEKGTTVDKLAQDNHIANPNMIIVGQVLSTDGNTTNTNNTQQTPVQTQPQVQTPVVQQQATPQSNQPVQQTQQTVQSNNSTGYQAPATSNNYTSAVTGDEASAKAWIAARESGGNYGARNGQYIGKYQLSASYLNGDYSEANQERVADQYCQQRYGSWQEAQKHWEQNGWW